MMKASAKCQVRYLDPELGKELFSTPLPEYIEFKNPTHYFKALSNKCLGYLTTVDVKISFPILDDRQLTIDSTLIVDFYMQEHCQRKGHGIQLFEYFLLCKGIEARQVSLYKPTKSIMQFMSKHFGLKTRLPEGKLLFTYMDILGTEGDRDFDLYQKNIEFQEKLERKPKVSEYRIFSNAGKRIMQSK